METGGIRLAEYGLEADRRIDALMERKQEAMAMINQLPDRRMALLLILRYVNALEWDVIMEKSGYERAHVNRMNTGALRTLQEAITAKETAAR